MYHVGHLVDCIFYLTKQILIIYQTDFTNKTMLLLSVWHIYIWHHLTYLPNISNINKMLTAVAKFGSNQTNFAYWNIPWKFLGSLEHEEWLKMNLGFSPVASESSETRSFRTTPMQSNQSRQQSCSTITLWWSATPKVSTSTPQKIDVKMNPEKSFQASGNMMHHPTTSSAWVDSVETGLEHLLPENNEVTLPMQWSQMA